MTKTGNFLALDVGSKRIGVAKADTDVKIAVPMMTILVDGTELNEISKLIDEVKPEAVIIGYPRNQAGEATEQTKSVEKFAESVQALDVEIVFRDESLTSVMAEDRLHYKGKNSSVERSEIDAEAAAIILQDYLEENYGY